ncbi:MAG: PQQ-binding-like beta-propeller repeat protein [Magnetospirillum sp.]|nr:PQQ-binding-like beta-propeller repeat protein [Magnetospirillum sp.]
MKRRLALASAGLIVAAGLAACDTWLGDNPDPPLPGKRIAVLSQDNVLTTDKEAPIRLPPPEINADWPEAGGLANHAMHHMKVGATLKKAWETNVGTGSSARIRLLAQPVVADGKVFTLDADKQVSALDAKTGNILWQADITPDNVEGGSGGGLAYDNGHLYVATGFAQVVAVNAKDGKVVWRQPLSGPMRGAPTVRGGRVFVITVDDQVHCLSAEDGKELWSQQGIAEQASLLSGTSPAVDGNVVIVPYSSGELFALRVENGAVLWQDSLSAISRTQGIGTLTDIRGRPIIDRGKVYAVGHSDLLVAIDLRSGRRVWERDIGGMQSPWIAGDYLFLVTNDNEAVAVDATNGHVLWVTQLQTWKNPDIKTHRIVWAGPVLASDRLIFGSSHGYLLSLSPYTGKVLGYEKAPAGISIQPVVADGTIYFYTDDADVVAYR